MWRRARSCLQARFGSETLFVAEEGEVIVVDRDVGNLDVHDPEKKTVKSFSTLIGNDRRWYRFPVYVETLVSPHLNNVAA